MNRSNRLSLYFWVFLALNLAFIAWSRTYLKPLTTRDIVKFEVAKTLPVAEKIIAEWKADGKFEKAKQSIVADYFFIFLYTTGFIITVFLLARLSNHVLLHRTGRFILVLMPIAAICDIIENVAMYRSLSGHLTALNVTLAYDMAVAKFSIIILTMIFLFICLLFWIGSKFAPKYKPLSA
ncbi:MAG TPA: hypothetical protein VGD17_06705 [Chitinophagaceae bacterium]